MRKKVVYGVSLLVLLGALGAEACFLPKVGYGWGHDELVGKATIILLAELENIETEGSFTVYILKPVEVLKGDAPEQIRFLSHSHLPDVSDDFNAHSDYRFWNEDIGRSDWPCCICGPDHAFTFDETYLLFPDAFGAMKSAEAIHSDEDQWLTYVKKQIKPAYSTRDSSAANRE